MSGLLIENRDFLQLILLLAAMSYAACSGSCHLLRKLSILDAPGARSNHNVPTAVGGGIGFAVVIAFALWVGGSFVIAPKILHPAFAVSVLLLTVISLIDDVVKLPVRIRVFAQIVAMTITLKSTGIDILQLGSIQAYAAIPLCLIGWFWFINLFNFMDGIDGLAASEAIFISVGIAIVGYITNHPEAVIIGGFIFAAVLPFLFFNWQPAKIFMGDAGSITLGFVLGFTLLLLTSQGFLIAALILPAYFVSDATYTIICRIKRKEKVWQAHSSHAYQVAVRSGLSHRKVTLLVCLLNIVLIPLAVLSVKNSNLAAPLLLLAYMLSASLMRYFTKNALAA